MNIVTYTQTLVKEADEKTSSCEAALKKASLEIAGIAKKIGELSTTRDRLIAVGLNKNKNEADLMMDELKAKLVPLSELETAKAAAVEESKASREKLKNLERLAELCEQKLKQVEIPELVRVRDFQAQISAELRFENNVAKSCRLWIGAHRSQVREFELPLKSEIERIRRGVVPATLAWIPDEWLPVRPSSQSRPHQDTSVDLVAAKSDALSQLYFVKETETFVPLWPEIKWTEIEMRPRNPGVWNSPRDEVPETKKEKWGVSEEALTEQVAKIFEGQIVDLDLESDDPFIKMLAEKIRETTQPRDQITYVRNTEVLKIAEIEKRIGASFRKFVDAPWTAETKGLLANLKYYCEQVERPRFHSCEVEGAYGFRLRTRDHNWIKGWLYVVPDALPYESEFTSLPEVKNNYGSSALLRIGRLILRVEGESRD